MELAPSALHGGLIVEATRSAFTIAGVAEILGEDEELLWRRAEVTLIAGWHQRGVQR